MANEFDPYYRWMGIPPKDQPPNHYRLLGLELFESDADAIENAADRHTAYIRTFQSGSHAGASQKLLNEIATAKVCLLDPHKRAAYDAELRQQPKEKQAKRAPRGSEPKRLPTAAPLEQPAGAPPVRGQAVGNTAPLEHSHRSTDMHSAPIVVAEQSSESASSNGPLAILNTPLSEIGKNYAAIALVTVFAGGVSLFLLIAFASTLWRRGDAATDNGTTLRDEGGPAVVTNVPPTPPEKPDSKSRPPLPSPTTWPAHVPTDARLYNGHYYRLYRVALPWRVARQRCAQLEGCLVRIESSSEQAFIRELLRGTTNPFWIDCSDDGSEGTWQFADGQPAPFTKWMAGEPNNAMNGENFVVLRNSNSAAWNDLSGGARCNFICEWEPTPVKHTAPAASIKIPADAKSFGGSQYKRFDDPCTRTVAERRCAEVGGHLARLESRGEQQFVHKLIEDGEKAFWIDGTDEIHEGRWRLSDGSAMEFTNWDPQQPDNASGDEHYATMFSLNGLWNDAPPDNRLGFVCEWSPTGSRGDPHLAKETSTFAGSRDDRRLAIPAPDERDEQLLALRRAFAVDEADTRNEKAQLAKRLLTIVPEERDDALMHYALLDLARELASQTGDIDTALQALEQLKRQFRVDAAHLQLTTLRRSADASMTSSQRGAYMQRGLEIAERLVQQDAHSQALDVLDALHGAASKARDARQLTAIDQRRKEIKQIASKYAVASDAIEAVARNPAHAGSRPESSLAAGRYYAFINGDWQRGLPLLAAGSDDWLKYLTALEMKITPDAADRLRLADGWYTASAAESGIPADRLKARAKFWYSQVGNELPGLAGVKVRKRLSELQNVAIDNLRPFVADAVVTQNEIDLLPLVDVQRHRITGHWRATSDGYRVDAKGNHGHLCLPVVPHGDYEIRARFTRLQADAGVSFVLPVGERRVRLVVCGAPQNGVASSGLLNINGLTLTQNATRNTKLQIVNGREYEMYAVVRLFDTRARITASLDGQSFLDWTGQRSALSVDGSIHHLHRGAPTIGIYRGAALFCELGMTMRNGIAQRWNSPIRAKYRVTLYPHQGVLEHVEFSPDGTWLVSAGASNRVVLWNLATEWPQRASPRSSSMAYGACFAKDGRTILSASADKTIRLMNTADFDTAEPLALTGHEGSVRMAVLSPDGKTAASVSTDRSVRLWDVESGEARPVRGQHAKSPWHVAYSPTGDVIATAGEDRLITLWEASTLRKLRSLAGHQATVRAVAFSPDGKVLASAGWDRTIRLWDHQTGTELAHIDAHNSQVEHVTYSPDGKFIASSGRDRTVKIWDADTRQCACVLPDHAQAVWCVAFSLDGRRLASCGPEGVVRLWDLTYAEDVPPETHVAEATTPTATLRKVDLMPLVEPTRDKVVGNWQRSGRRIVASNDGISAGRLNVPVAVSGSYHLRASFTRTSGKNTVGLILPVGDRQALLAFQHVGRNTSGLEMIDGAGVGLRGNPTDITPGRLVNGWRYEIDVDVRVNAHETEIRVARNGVPIVHWRGLQHEIALHPSWRVTNSRSFGLAVGHSSAEFDELTLSVPEDAYRHLHHSVDQ